MFMRAVDHAVAAVLSGDDARLAALLDADATLGLQRTMFGVSPLLAARAVGRVDLVAQLRPADPLPLVLAAEVGDVDAVRAALAADPAAVATRDANGSTALHGAAYWGRADVIELLLAAGADARATTTDDFLRIPVLGSAIATTPGVPQPSDDEDVVLRLVRSLLEHGAEPNAVRRDGMTALHSAAWRGFGRVVQELLDAGADRGARATDGPHAGQTPADVALAQGHLVLASALDSGALDVASPYG
jgi:ankyrin repeat protein